jgi:hypothetical protein
MTQTRIPALLTGDNSSDFFGSLADHVEGKGPQAHLAHSGEEALARFHENYFGGVLMDEKMPGRNGVETLLEVKKFLPDTPGRFDNGLFHGEFSAKSPAKWNLGSARGILGSGKVDRFHQISFAMIANPTMPDYSLGAP